jgi:hypothetical protein
MDSCDTLKNILSANQLFSLIDVKRKFINSDNHKFQLLLLWQKLEYPEKTTDLLQVTEKLLSHNVLSSTPLHAWGSNSPFGS